jgi:hypothetical protein
LNLDLIDLHVRLNGHPDLFPDTVHPNSKGMVAMAAVIFDGLAGGAPTDLPPPALIKRISATRIELSWPAHWGGLVPQTTQTLKTSNTVWTLVDVAIPFSDGNWIRQTNVSTGAPRFYRLWQP